MNRARTFADLQENELLDVLQSTGRMEPRAELSEARADRRGWFDKPWRYGNHQVGFVPNTTTADPVLEILPGGGQGADAGLENQPLVVKLDRVRVEDYPGVGGHDIVVNVEGTHRQGEGTVPLSFNQAYRVGRQDFAGVAGTTVFRGVNPGRQGLGLKFTTLHVASQGGKAFKTLLDSPAIRAGLTLLNAAQPALAPLTATAQSLLESLLDTEKAAVQVFELGLDFDTEAPAGYRLALGSYIVAQVPRDGVIHWEEWRWDRRVQAVVREGSREEYLPYNTLVFRVSRWVE